MTDQRQLMWPDWVAMILNRLLVVILSGAAVTAVVVLAFLFWWPLFVYSYRYWMG